MGLLTTRVVGTHRNRYQWWWMATVRHLICVNVWHMGLDVRDRNGDWYRNTSTTVEVVWKQQPTKLRAISCLLAFARLRSIV